MTDPVRRRRRRRHAAPVSRIVAAGLSASATFALVGVMGHDAVTTQDTSAAGAATTDTAAPSTTAVPPVVIIREVPPTASARSNDSNVPSTSQRSAPVTAAPGRTQSSTRSSGS